MIREIAKYPAPVLRAKGKAVAKVTDEIRELARDMIDTMEHANGVGLAAQQVGRSLQLAVIDVMGVEDRPSTMSVEGKPVALEKWMPLVLLNPKLELGGLRESGSEGCLSFPEITSGIERAASVTVRAMLLDGREVEFDATGLLARALQHEVDHLNGILFIDRMSSANRVSVAGKLKRLQKPARA